MGETSKVHRASRLLEQQIDGAAENGPSTFAVLLEAVDLIVNAAVEKAKAESLAVSDGMKGQISRLDELVNACMAKINDKDAPDPATPPEPAAHEWEVWAEHFDRAGNRTVTPDVIGHYPTQKSAERARDLLNTLTSQEHVFFCEQV